ncbi:MAG: protein kinase [Alphaproteobacteria bacterium]|nr:protein kinase [Alphaproteobacteria bacterium]
MAPSHRWRPELSDDALLREAQTLRQRGQYAEALERVEELQSRLRVAQVRPGDPRWGELLAQASVLHRLEDNLDKATELAQTLLEDARRYGWHRLRAEGLLSLARCARRREEYGQAETLAQEALRSLRHRRVPEREARALSLLADLAEARGESERAETLLLEALAIFKRIGAREHLPTGMTTLAGLYRRQGRIDEARELLGEAAELARALNLDFHLATSLYSLGLLHLHGGEAARGRPFMRRALRLYQRLNNHRGAYHAAIGLGEIERALGELDAARALYTSVVTASPPPDLRTRQVAWLNLSLIDLERARWPEAKQALMRVLPEAGGEVRSTCLALLLCAEAGLEDGQAWDDTEREWRASRDAHDPLELDIARSLERAGVLAMKRGEDLSRAARPLAAALEQYSRLRRDPDHARCARLLRELGDRGAPIPVGPFDLTGVIGSGGMGEVWRATHRDEGVAIALKVLTSHAARSNRGREALRDEVRAVATLNHPNIVPIFDHGRFGEAASEMTGRRLKPDNPCIAIELVEGGSLEAHCGRLPWAACRRALLDLLDALAHAHARGLVHRDIKPDNLLIERLSDDDLVIRLSDFGLAQAMGEASHTGIVGTPGYMAPEQFTGAWRQLGPWTDLYAVGCLGWTLVTGAPPFAHASIAELRDAHLSQAPPRLRPTVPVPDGFEPWLRRLLRKRPEERFQRAADALFALRQLPEDAPVYTGPMRHEPAASPASSSTFYFDLDPVGVPQSVHDPWPVAPSRPPPIPETWRHALRPLARLSSVGRNLVPLRDVPLVGRKEERRRCWEAVRSREPRVILIRGEAGVGRTRLAVALLRYAHETGAAETLRGTPGGSSELAEAIAKHHRWTGLSTPALLSAAQAWLEAFGAEQEAFALAELIRPGATSEPLTEPVARARVALDALCRLSRERSVVLLLDDAHEDPEAHALAWHLLEDPRRPPIVLVLTLREDRLLSNPQLSVPLERLAERPGVVELRLSPLSTLELCALLQGLLKLDPALAEHVAHRSAGNPAIAVELVVAWINEDMLVAGVDGFVARTDIPLPLPEQLHRRWVRRVDDVLEGQSADALPSLELAALLGDTPSPIEWLAACAAAQLTPPPELEDLLLDAGLALPTPEGWRFAHPLLRESLIAVSRAAGRAERLHLACARILAVHGGSTLRRGRHLYAAGQLVEAVPLLLDAMEEARAAGDAQGMEEAAACARDALARAGAAPDDPRWRALANPAVRRRETG